MKTTKYFRQVQPIKHPEASHQVAFWVFKHYEYGEIQEVGRFRRWGYVPELRHWIRLIIEPDGETIHNAFIDSGFRPRDK